MNIRETPALIFDEKQNDFMWGFFDSVESRTKFRFLGQKDHQEDNDFFCVKPTDVLMQNPNKTKARIIHQCKKQLIDQFNMEVDDVNLYEGKIDEIVTVLDFLDEQCGIDKKVCKIRTSAGEEVFFPVLYLQFEQNF